MGENGANDGGKGELVVGVVAAAVVLGRGSAEGGVLRGCG